MKNYHSKIPEQDVEYFIDMINIEKIIFLNNVFSIKVLPVEYNYVNIKNYLIDIITDYYFRPTGDKGFIKDKIGNIYITKNEEELNIRLMLVNYNSDSIYNIIDNIDCSLIINYMKSVKWFYYNINKNEFTEDYFKSRILESLLEVNERSLTYNHEYYYTDSGGCFTSKENDMYEFFFHITSSFVTLNRRVININNILTEQV